MLSSHQPLSASPSGSHQAAASCNEAPCCSTQPRTPCQMTAALRARPQPPMTTSGSWHAPATSQSSSTAEVRAALLCLRSLCAVLRSCAAADAPRIACSHVLFMLCWAAFNNPPYGLARMLAPPSFPPSRPGAQLSLPSTPGRQARSWAAATFQAARCSRSPLPPSPRPRLATDPCCWSLSPTARRHSARTATPQVRGRQLP